MATEKILIFDEAGNAKRMKVRIARFLDNEPVTASDKENIRTTLNVDGSQSGTFTTPLSVTSASDSSFSGGGNVTVSGGKTTLTNDSDNALVVETTNKNPMFVNVVGAAPNYLFDVRDDGTSKFRIDGSGRVGIGGSPAYELDVQGGNARIAATSDAGVVNHLQADNTGAYVGPLSNHNLFFKQNNITRWAINTTGNLVASSGLGIDFGSTVFDTYEEGLYSATLTPSTSGTITLDGSVNAISYTIIGRVAHIQGKVNVTAVSSPVGDYVKLNLPAAIDVPDINEDSGKTVGTVSIIGAAGAMNEYVLIAVEGEAYLRIYKGTSSSPVATAPDFNGDEAVYINASYIIS